MVDCVERGVADVVTEEIDIVKIVCEYEHIMWE